MGIVKKGKDYYIQYSLYVVNEDGEKERVQKQEKIGPSRQLAEAAHQKRLLERTEQKFFPREEKKKPITLSDFIPRYMANSKLTKSPKMQDVDYNSTRHLEKHLGDEYLHAITPGKVQEYIEKRLKEVSPSSTNRDISCLKTMLNRAVEWELLEANPVAKVKKLLEPPERIRYLMKEEIIRLLACCIAHLVPIVQMALWTGMRKGEIMRLKWCNVDMKNRMIQVKYPTRSKKQGRIVPIGKKLLKVLEGLTKDHEFVFRGLKDPKKGFKAACRKAGIQDFRFHDLRHTAASWMIMAGVNIVAVQKILGHAKIEMTLRYVQLNEETLRQAVETLENELATE